MNREIIKRLASLETCLRKPDVPSLVMISYNDKTRSWDVVEVYMKRDGRGNVVRGGRRKKIAVKRIDDYTPPRGFRGTMIIDNITE